MVRPGDEEGGQLSAGQDCHRTASGAGHYYIIQLTTWFICFVFFLHKIQKAQKDSLVVFYFTFILKLLLYLEQCAEAVIVSSSVEK